MAATAKKSTAVPQAAPLRLQKAYTAESIAAMAKESRPTIILADDWAGEPDPRKEGGKPAFYKYCPSCESRVSGNATTICPHCKKEIPRLTEPKTSTESGKPAFPRGGKSVLTYSDYESARQLTTDLGDGDIDVALNVLKEVKKLGSIDEAIRAIEAWSNLVNSAGGESVATGILDTMLSSGALAK